MISHGYTVKEQDDPIVDIVEDAMNQFSVCVEPGAFLADMVPLCKPPLSCRPHRLVVLTAFHSPTRTCTVQCDTFQIGFLELGGKRKLSCLVTL